MEQAVLERALEGRTAQDCPGDEEGPRGELTLAVTEHCFITTVVLSFLNASPAFKEKPFVAILLAYL